MDDHDTDGAESAATYESDGAESAATFQRDYVSDAGGDYSDFNIDLDEVEEDVQPQPTSHQKHQQKTNSNKRKISIGGGFIVENEVDTSRIKRNKKTKILDNVQDVTSLEDIAKRLLQ